MKFESSEFHWGCYHTYPDIDSEPWIIVRTFTWERFSEFQQVNYLRSYSTWLRAITWFISVEVEENHIRVCSTAIVCIEISQSVILLPRVPWWLTIYLSLSICFPPSTETFKIWSFNYLPMFAFLSLPHCVKVLAAPRISSLLFLPEIFCCLHIRLYTLILLLLSSH